MRMIDEFVRQPHLPTFRRHHSEVRFNRFLLIVKLKETSEVANVQLSEST